MLAAGDRNSIRIGKSQRQLSRDSKATDLAVVLGLSGSKALEGSIRSDLSPFLF